MLWQGLTPLGCRGLDTHLQLAGVLLVLWTSTQGGGVACQPWETSQAALPLLQKNRKNLRLVYMVAAEGSRSVENPLAHRPRNRAEVRFSGRERASKDHKSRVLETIIPQPHLKQVLGKVRHSGA